MEQGAFEIQPEGCIMMKQSDSDRVHRVAPSDGGYPGRGWCIGTVLLCARALTRCTY
jgi:hypothetical protein